MEPAKVREAVRRVSCVSCARRMVSSSDWSRTSHSIATSCRRSCKKSCEASSSTRAWALDANRLRTEHAAGVGADDDQSVDDELPEPERSATCAANTAARAGSEPGAVRLSPPDGDAEARGLGGERKRIYRLYTEDGLAVRTKVRKKIARRSRVPTLRATRPNEKWSMDFVAARLIDGRWFRVLTVVDQFTRECVLLLADSSLTGHKVALALSQAIAVRGAPVSITVDNGTEFASRAMEAWAYQYGVQLDFIRPGRPVENSYIESFNGRLRDECLNVEVFFTLADVRDKLERWRQDYNQVRPHSALRDNAPAVFAAQWTETAAPGPEPVPDPTRKPAAGDSLETLT